MTFPAPARRERRWGHSAALRATVALVAMLTVILVGLAGIIASPASAQTLRQPETGVGASTAAAGQVVGAHEPVLAGQRRARAPSYDRTAVGSAVAAEGEWTAPETSINRHGQLTNGTYTIDEPGMAQHRTGSLAAGKSQWFSGVDAETATLDAASYADENKLWIGNKAKVPVTNGVVGALGTTGEPTSWINVYRTDTGFVHGSPGSAP